MVRAMQSSAPAPRRRVLLLVPVALVVSLAALFAHRPLEASTKPPKTSKRKAAKAAAPEAPAEDKDKDKDKDKADDAKDAPKGPAQIVDIGIYLHHVPTIDLKTNTYLADFYLWFHWTGDIDPTKTFEFTNAVETWDLHKRAVYNDDAGNPKNEDIADGSKYQCFHIQGRFLNPFRLQNYPFDEQDILIRVEDAEYQADKMVYRVDKGGAKHHPGVEIPGWELAGSTGTVKLETYASNFGDPRVDPKGDVYTQFLYTLHVVRPVKGYLIKTLLPIAIVIAIAFVVFFIPLGYFDGRLGLAITNLISAVALQLSTSSDLPSVGYLVLLDKIYNLAYLVIFGSLFESVLVTRIHDSGKVERARRIDRWSAGLLLVVIVVGLAFILRSRA